MKLTAIVAISDNGIIGKDGALPWHQPADLKHFKRRTVGKPIIMGRRTYEEVGRPLPDRVNVVLTRGPAPEGCLAAPSLDAALALPEVAEAPEVMIIGGAQVYESTLARCHELWLTRVHATVEGDTRLALDLGGWALAEREDYPADDRNAHPMTFERWVRGKA